MDPRQEIEQLVAFEGRAAGTDAERRAAAHLGTRLRALGREAEVEPIAIHPNWALAHLLHALLAAIGSLVAVAEPVAGALLVAAAALSALGDLTGTLFLVRRLTGRRASQNVTSREHGGKPGVLVLVAHYDAGRGGPLFGPRAAALGAALAQRLRLPVGLGGGFLLAILVLLVSTILRAFGLESVALEAVQFAGTAALVVSVPVLAALGLARPVPGAADNAAGVATALRLAERHGGDLDHLDLWILFTGAEEAMALGMREWLRAHRAELPRAGTLFLNLDKLGRGEVRYTTREGPVVAARHDRLLAELCAEIAAGDEGRGRYEARPHVALATSDAVAARSRGYRAITISCLDARGRQPDHHGPRDTPERVDSGSLDRALAFCSELIERLDERIGPELEPGSERHEG